MKLNGYDVFSMYIAMKNHFTGKSYDYHKYNGKCNATVNSFNRRKDKYFFDRLSNNYEAENIEGVLLSQFISNDVYWVGDLDNDIYLRWLGRQERLYYDFKQAIDLILNKIEEEEINFSDLFNNKDGNHPIILNEVLQDSITQESFIIFNEFVPFFHILDKNITYPLIWNNYKKKCTKYKNFIKYDRRKFKSYLVEKLKEIT